MHQILSCNRAANERQIMNDGGTEPLEEAKTSESETEDEKERARNARTHATHALTNQASSVILGHRRARRVPKSYGAVQRCILSPPAAGCRRRGELGFELVYVVADEVVQWPTKKELSRSSQCSLMQQQLEVETRSIPVEQSCGGVEATSLNARPCLRSSPAACVQKRRSAALLLATQTRHTRSTTAPFGLPCRV